MTAQILTKLAVMSLTTEGRLIEVHYRDGLDLDEEGLSEVLERRTELTTDRCAMIAFFPQGTMGSMAAMDVDHFGRTKASEQLIALAIVTEDDLGEAMSGIYYSYHPQPFPTRIFRSEREAREWIAGQLVQEFG